jgi:two-component system CAI-1 autoinducer sensor kinase/phosphatase CqsS
MYSDTLDAFRRRIYPLRRALRLAHNQTSLAAVRLQLLSLIGLAGHPLCFLLWHRLWPQEYDSAALRLVAMLQSGVCLFAHRFSRRWQQAMLLLLLSYQLSFFFTYMFLMNHAAQVAAETLLIALIALFHFETPLALLAYAIGSIAACAAAALTGEPDTLTASNVLQQLPIHAFAIFVISAVKISRHVLEGEKLAGLQSGLASVSHELRTPLISVEANVRGLQRTLSETTGPGAEERQHCAEALGRIQFEVRHMNHMIDLFLLSARAVNRNLLPRETVSMAGAIDTMLGRYPFTSDAQRGAVTVDLRRDFTFAGQADLSVVILLNLLRNALKAIHRAGKGRVRIIVDGARATPRLLFIDTACGVAAERLPLIFRRFYSYPSHQGSGIGLALCHDIMSAWSARIRCVSREQAYAIFVLEFPTPPANHR